ncbi:MAG: DUF1987 domain-containing protein [Crocinitomicaceae bacterium]|nr:DUF1987 domain-containing protein [Crocinitomicaceae bacterium]
MHPESLLISKTEDTPEVIFDAEKKLISIRGRSLPENAFGFYNPLLEWMRSYCSKNTNPTLMEVSLDYFNSSSGRYIFELLTIVENCEKNKKCFEIRWYTDADDELMIEKGEELKSLVDLNFTILRND